MVREEDVKKEISIKLQEGSRKRKREVEVWLEDMKKIKEEYPRFVEEEEGKGFMKRMLGGDEALTKMNERIGDLDSRSRLFGELVLADHASGTGELEAAAIFPEVSGREAVSSMNASERDQICQLQCKIAMLEQKLAVTQDEMLLPPHMLLASPRAESLNRCRGLKHLSYQPHHRHHPPPPLAWGLKTPVLPAPPPAPSPTTTSQFTTRYMEAPLDIMLNVMRYL